LVEATEILIQEGMFFNLKARNLLSGRDYVLVDEVSLITQIPVKEECCTCKYIGRSRVFIDK